MLLNCTSANMGIWLVYDPTIVSFIASCGCGKYVGKKSDLLM